MRVWSDQQESIFRWFAAGTGHLVVRARAGTGKTTTIVEATSRAPEPRVLLAAFNKKIATELQSRLAHPGAEAATLHSIGFACVKRFWERVGIDQDRAENLAREACGSGAPDAIVRLVAKLNRVAREVAPHAGEDGPRAANAGEAVETVAALADEYDCVPSDDWAEDGYDVAWVAKRALDAMAIAAETRPARGIDFADMIYLPIRNRWLRPKYDLVVIDEAQDMTAAQLEIARGVCRGRVCVVGDDRQAIYGFRGADSTSIDRLKAELGATELGLTVTYRCGRSIVADAARLVPDYRAADGADAGTVRTAALESACGAAEPGDFVLSRKNAPLVRVALRLLRAGKRAKVEGRDIGAGLRAIVTKLGKGGSSIDHFLAALTAWEQRETERASAMGPKGEAKLDKIADQAEVLRALTDGLSSVRELDARIIDLFADDASRAHVVCSSIHRAKGLEAERVWLLADTLYPPLPCTCGHRHISGRGCTRCSCATHVPNAARMREEQNLEYVAITRAKNELVRVAGLP